MGKNAKTLTVVLISVLLIGFFFSIYVTKEEGVPGNAIVVVTLEDQLYHSIHFDHVCVAGKTAKSMTVAQATSKGYRPHVYDLDLNYFRGNRRFLFHDLLSQIGVQVNSRWDRTGNWLW